MNRFDSLVRTPLRHNFLVALAIAGTALLNFTATAAVAATPTISGTPVMSVAAGTAYSYTPRASDPAGGKLTFSIKNKPSWGSFSATTGTLSGTPTAANVGTTPNIDITVSNGSGSNSIAAFWITVTKANGTTAGGGTSGGGTTGGGTTSGSKPPVISGSPGTTVAAGTAYSFKPTANDPAGKSLSFSVQNKPSWAAFSLSTGTLSGTPTAAQVGSYSNIVISASDGAASAALRAFNITVTAASPGAPALTITGTPLASATVGAAYSFTPTAKDSTSGAKLTFSVVNKPSWASFNTSTGALSGTPVAANVGSFTGIAITVNDGKASAALSAFAITVKAASGGATGSATVKWVAPTQNSDGSALTNLAGYHVHYGTSASNLNQTATVATAGATSYALSQLTSATWYFGVTSYTTGGTESAMSNVGSKTIP